MQRAVAWLYARSGRRYFESLLLLFAAAILLFVVPGYTAITLPYFRTNGAQYLEFLWIFEIAIVCANAGMFALALSRHAPMIRWLRGERTTEAAPAAWDSAVAGIPRTVLIMVLWYALCCAPAAIIAGSKVHLSAPGVALYIVALELLIIGMGVFAYLLLEQALRPVVREIAALLPARFAATRTTPSLGVKLLALLPAINIFTGMIVAAVSTNTLGLEARLAVTVAVTLLVSLTLSLTLTLLFRQSLLTRLSDLQEAIARVDKGDYGARVQYLAGDELDEVGGRFNKMVEGLAEREMLQGALGSYVDAGVATRMLSEGAILQGREVDVTVLFLDIREFTWLAARSTPPEIVAYLDAFFDLVIPIVRKHHGHPNKLLGDGLLAVFGAPADLDRHADHALSAAREILIAVWRRYQGELRIGLGLNSGDVVAGTIGGGGKLDYTLIGDAVNVAARIEALTKEIGDPLLITESTRRLLTGPLDKIAPRGSHRLKGKAGETSIFAVEVAPPTELRDTLTPAVAPPDS
jgi:adenylate cyclase